MGEDEPRGRDRVHTVELPVAGEADARRPPVRAERPLRVIPDTLRLVPGQSTTLVVVRGDSAAGPPTFFFYPNEGKEEIATVDAAGRVTATEPGTGGVVVQASSDSGAARVSVPLVIRGIRVFPKPLVRGQSLRAVVPFSVSP